MVLMIGYRLIFLLLAVGSLRAASFDAVANYTKSEFQVPMRDGKRLFTAVYMPKDTSISYPFLMTRTPYSVAPYGASNFPKVLGPAENFARDKFIFVYQDVRGRYMSEGDWIEMTPAKDTKHGMNDVDESSDTYDTIAWLLKNIPNNNGKVGLIGISYPGFYTSAGMINAHPALVAASPQAPVSDLYMGDDSFHNGAFFLPANFGFYSFFGKQNNPTLPSKNENAEPPTQDGYRFYLQMGSLTNADEKYLHYTNPYWTEMIKHPNYDQFWQARNILPHLVNIKPAVLVVGGWYDAEDLSGTLKTFKAIQKNSPTTSENIVMGPWVHGGWSRGKGNQLGDIDFGSDTASFFQNEIELPFFRRYLKDAPDPLLPKAYMFETGTNTWRKKEQWPPAEAKLRKLYFHAVGTLEWDKTDPSASGAAFDEYISDPNNPVPFSAKPVGGMNREYMDADQRFVMSRPDVLTYQTSPLARDITIAGPISPHLFVSTSGTDSDFVVKVIDVYPDDAGSLKGYAELIRGEPFRGKFRKSFEHPEPFVPNQVESIAFSMPDVYHCFRKGHRIMVQIQSSWFPLVDRNPQTFTNIPTAKAAEFQKAAERLYRSATSASFVEFGLEPN